MVELTKGMRVVVVGLGASGLAAARFLHTRGVRVAVSESRPKREIAEDVLVLLKKIGAELETGGHTESFFNNADLVIPSPGVPLDLPILKQARERGAVVAGELALTAGRIEVPVIAVTGSNGKTTVTSLIGGLLQAAGRRVFVGGNIGTPVLEYLLGPRDADVVVLELSSFQLELSGSFRPYVALLLNLSPDHLDRHGSMENYAAAKQRIFAHQSPDDRAILGSDDPLVMAAHLSGAGRVLRFGTVPGSEALVRDGDVLVPGPVFGGQVDEEYQLLDTRLGSRVNRLNSAAAILAARAVGCDSESIRRGLGDYTPLEHRLELIAEIDGVRFVDDSKATNIGAVATALSSGEGPVILIGGGRDKGSDFSLLAPTVKRHVRVLILIGEAAPVMSAALGSFVPVHTVAEMDDAVRLAAATARPGDTVLLSPGCASFDMFSGYAERGRVFQQAVHDLGAPVRSAAGERS